MNLDVPVSDERRIEVVANGLPLGMAPNSPWMPPSSPPSQDAARPTRAPTSSRAARSLPPRAASAPKHTPSWTERAVVGWSSSASKLAAGLVPKRCNSCASLLAIGQRRYRPTCGPPQSPPGSPAGPDCWLSLPSAPTQPPSSNSPLPPSWARGPCLPCMRSLPMRAGGEGARCRYRPGCRSVAGSELLLHWDRRTPVAKRSAKKKKKTPLVSDVFADSSKELSLASRMQWCAALGLGI